MEYLWEQTVEYTEILELYLFCKEHGVNAELKFLYDGFKIAFPDGSDFIQHNRSYGCHDGCVEPAIGSPYDYTGIELSDAKSLVIIYKNKLNEVAAHE